MNCSQHSSYNYKCDSHCTHILNGTLVIQIQMYEFNRNEIYGTIVHTCKSKLYIFVVLIVCYNIWEEALHLQKFQQSQLYVVKAIKK